MFGRRSASDPTESDTEAERAELEAAQGKGRATPKRKEAEAARKKRLAPPRNRKEANALHKQRSREQRLKQRQAMAGGDEKYLPARDQGQVKRFVRDYVDSRRTIGEFLIPAFLLVFLFAIVLGNAVPSLGTFAWIAILVLLAVDSVRVLHGVRKGVTERFGASETNGITMYTLMRSWQMRRLRLPKATVKPGAKI